MEKRQVTLEDGRYLIFYNFGDEAGARGGEARTDAPPEPGDPRPVATEEGGVGRV